MTNPIEKIRNAAKARLPRVEQLVGKGTSQVVKTVRNAKTVKIIRRTRKTEAAPSESPLVSVPPPIQPSISTIAAAPQEVHIVTPEEMTPAEARKVGLKPSSDWHKRNFLTEVLIPSLFTPRVGEQVSPLYPALKESEIGITWIGHASFLLQTPGGNLLIDPNWAKWLKVIKRIRHPGMPIHHLPAIDLVLVTHAHFDHLDRRSLRLVAEDQPIIVPFEVGNLVHDLGFRSVHELSYWQQFSHGPATITLTPCHHWGARFLHDSHRGFGGYIIEVGGRTIYHCGDTAFFDGFKEIGSRFPIDIALLPIGAYDPPSGREVHMNPEEAVRAFLELGAQQMVPMHYGSFRLSYEPPDEPLLRLRAAARDYGVEDRIAVMTEGHPLVF